MSRNDNQKLEGIALTDPRESYNAQELFENGNYMSVPAKRGKEQKKIYIGGLNEQMFKKKLKSYKQT